MVEFGNRPRFIEKERRKKEEEKRKIRKRNFIAGSHYMFLVSLFSVRVLRECVKCIYKTWRLITMMVSVHHF